MRIAIGEWTRAVVLGGAVVVSLVVTSPRPLTVLALDLLDDGQPGVTMHGDDLRPVRAMAITPTRAGTFRLVVEATDSAGCQDRTGALRRVEVTR